MSCFPTESCQIIRETEGHTDENTGKWIEAGDNTVANAEVDVQPKSGQERAAELQTKYESDYKGFIEERDIEFEDGFEEIKSGDILELTESGEKYRIVFPGKWDQDYELELKEQ